MSYQTGVRWKSLPFVVFGFVMLSWIVFDASGVIDFDGVVQRMRAADPVTTAAVIFALLLVDVLLPVPSTPLFVLAGTALGVPGGAALVIAGAMASSAGAYVLGRWARPVLVRRVVSLEDMAEMHRWWRTYGPWLFGVARGVPMLVETVGVSAGISHTPFRSFFGYTLLGTAPICTAYVIAGTYAETVEQIVMISVVGFLVTAGVAYLLRRRLR
ncbi:membrane protein DedA, SNARE-associated domain [Lentzea albidocapillata subsp. violacea]|uniref:Membrane protein DedA, SNARE-associated domain n=1 Tax=Lentzea albidocapillata subsp. violacea TaxID=128104 RepID=A0A1G9WUV9_9PSEU|nr:VTT domain-containing protein [Lentzea albidocapillata]SDM88384.1 membrane protein DedA, SNARE-associated domain [Lentzea albidocapillata subsp. violacea]